MLKVMADHDVEGHLDLLLRIWTSPPWDDLWRDLHGDVESFQRLGIAYDTPDEKIWQLCQQQGIVLITGNRNAESEESLEATIEKLGSANSLPVLTIADPKRLMRDRDYAECIAERVLEYISSIWKTFVVSAVCMCPKQPSRFR